MATIGSMLRPGGGTLSQQGANGTTALRLWLFALAALVALMVVIGGATRLTGSGLSITEWQPIVGTIPPLTDAAWQDAFEKYKAIPQYQKLNKGMSLDAFKSIFWWEWSHRLLGRLIGAFFLLPFLYFVARGRVRGPLAWQLGGLFVLGGLQGALGWFMVMSGLSQRTEVSQYRLAAHLLLASALFAALLWTALRLRAPGSHHISLRTEARGSAAIGRLIVALTFVQIGAGALVAGLKAGLAYDTWPLMDGHLVPNGIALLQPWWENLFENAATVQFDHRMIAYALGVLVLWHATRVIRSADDEEMRLSAWGLLAALVLQIALGVATLLLHVPLHLALTHQAVAMLVLAAAIWHVYALGRR